MTFTWPSIPQPVAAGPRLWLNQAQGPVNEEATGEREKERKREREHMDRERENREMGLCSNRLYVLEGHSHLCCKDKPLREMN